MSRSARQLSLRLSVARGLGAALLQMLFRASLYSRCADVPLPLPLPSPLPHTQPHSSPPSKVNHVPVPALTWGDRIPKTRAVSGEIPGDADTR